jgi:DNA-binding CsgD family transcriptional regulator
LTLLLIQQDYAAAARLIPNSLERLAQNKINADYIPGVYYLEAHSFWQQGRLDKMREAIEQFAGFPESTALYGRDIRLCLLNGRLALALANYREAETLLQQAVSAHQALRHTMMLHEPRLALALLYHQWGREAEALAVLKPTLLQLRQREMPGVVLQEGASIVPLLQLAVQQGLEQEFVQPLIMILGETAAARPLQIPNSTEALSPREVEVLRLVATGATNQAIAAQLVITERTVKAHVSSILQKLGAATRTEAVSRAREWLLIT